LIQRGELVEMKPLGTDYILTVFGYSVSGEPFAHYDSATKQDIPLAATEEGLNSRTAASVQIAVKESAAQLAAIEADWRELQA